MTYINEGNVYLSIHIIWRLWVPHYGQNSLAQLGGQDHYNYVIFWRALQQVEEVPK